MCCRASLVEYEVRGQVDRPSGNPVINSKWMFTEKRGLSGKVAKCKAPLVASFVQEEVYLETPELSGKVLRLMKAMYALNQSPRMWSLRIEKDFSEFNLYRLTAHFCVYDVFKGAGWVLLGTFLQDVFVFGKIMLLPKIYLGEVLL